ncbi:hypothetical protein LSTR_LSTR015714, partial [Laodelphax striatellus]
AEVDICNKDKKTDGKESETDLLPKNSQLINTCETLRCALNYISKKTVRTHLAARYACQATKELLKQCRTQPGLSLMRYISRLLNRTADSNKVIRFDANSALDDTWFVHFAHKQVEGTGVEGPSHKNPLARIATARLLLCIATIVGVNVLFTSAIYQKTRKRMLEAAAHLMDDTNLEAKNTAKSLFEMFVKDEHFEQLFYNEVDQKIVDRLHNTITIMRYKDKANV